jgi:hypothetical protein
MAKHATDKTNSPKEEDVQTAMANIEQGYADLASERGIYMSKCKKIRGVMEDDYKSAANLGISKKLLKKIVKGRELERKIDSLTADLEPDEVNEHAMLMEKLGEFANTPLGKAAMAAVAGADGKGTPEQQAGA